MFVSIICHRMGNDAEILAILTPENPPVLHVGNGLPNQGLGTS